MAEVMLNIILLGIHIKNKVRLASQTDVLSAAQHLISGEHQNNSISEVSWSAKDDECVERERKGKMTVL